MSENGKSLLLWSYKVTDSDGNANTTTEWRSDPKVAEDEANQLIEKSFPGGTKELRRLDQVYSTEILALMASGGVSF